MAATDTEAIIPKPVENPQGAGVLGWLGFVILNVAAWGIIAVSARLQVWAGFAVCLVYAVLVTIMALLVVRWGERFKAFENLLWVLSAIFVCVLGAYLSINVVCESAGECQTSSIGDVVPQPPEVDNGLRDLLPDSSSTNLQEWAAENDFYKQAPDNYFHFLNTVFFTGHSKSDKFSNVDTLHQVDIGNDNPNGAVITPILTSNTAGQEYLTDARNYAVLGGEVFFTAQPLSVNGDATVFGIYKAKSTAVLVRTIASHSSSVANAMVTSSFIENNTLYLKVQDTCSQCNYCTVWSIVRSDGTAEGTVDLRGDDRCAMPGNMTPTQAPSGSHFSGSKPTHTLWSLLFLAVVPMILVAGFVLWWKQLPGLILNLYYGFAAIVILIYMLAETNGDNIDDFLKWFITLYTGIALLVLTLPSLLAAELPAIFKEMEDWIVVLAGLPFFVVIHIDLNIPTEVFQASVDSTFQEAWKWVIYVFFMLFHMFVSIALGHTLPMVLGAIQAFVTAWKISREIVTVATGNDGASDVQILMTFGLMAFQGICIIALAILYASRRQQIEEIVHGSLRCLKRGQVTPM